jgi:phosphoribosylaminoimidazolecarboxamide formyltransferase/IMP cyclohydrolase
LYPFSSDPSIELIDVGGPTMVRAAAKNHEHVGIVTSPADYGVVLEELRASGSLSAATRRRLARAAFAHTAAYDAAIVEWLDTGGPKPVGELEGASEADVQEASLSAILPPTLHLTLERTELVGRHGPARRLGPVVPQHLRRRRRLAPRARAGRRRGRW